MCKISKTQVQQKDIVEVKTHNDAWAGTWPKALPSTLM